jgi:hypothetical protein
VKTNTNQAFWEIFYIRGFDDKQQILSEAVRIVKTYRYLQKSGINISDSSQGKEHLFQTMKKISAENGLGHFPGDRDFFYDLYTLAESLNLVGLLYDSYKNERTGTVLAPDYLITFLSEMLSGQVSSVMIAEAEKMAAGLQAIIDTNPEISITLTTDQYTVFLLLEAAFQEYQNVKVANQSIYRELLIADNFDLILSIPTFGGRFSREETPKSFITQETETIALENLIQRINDRGSLVAVIPAKLTFASGQIRDFRKWILENYSLDSIYSLPDGIFRPYTGIKTYLAAFSKAGKDSIVLGSIGTENYRMQETRVITMPSAEFRQYDDWRAGLFLSKDNEEIQRFKASGVKKVKLKSIADIFRGKSVLKDDVKPGEIFILNISNIEEGEVLFDHMDTINEEERKIRRYQLEGDDILLTCRGTVNKVALFPETRRTVIASANIIVIRVKEKVLPQYLKIFLESPLGQLLVKSFQRGTNVMNINPNDIGELEVPLLPITRQRELAERFANGLRRYKSEREVIEKRWESQRTEIFQELLTGGD